MRYFALCLALALAACGSADPITPDASQPPDAPVVDVADAAVDTAAPDATPDTATDAAVEASVDAAPDAVVDVAIDAPPEATVDAGVDAARDAARDVAGESDPCGGFPLAHCDVQGVPMCVDVQRGRMIGDHIEHCGACGTTCPSGQVCLELRCQSI